MIWRDSKGFLCKILWFAVYSKCEDCFNHHISLFYQHAIITFLSVETFYCVGYSPLLLVILHHYCATNNRIAGRSQNSDGEEKTYCNKQNKLSEMEQDILDTLRKRPIPLGHYNEITCFSSTAHIKIFLCPCGPIIAPKITIKHDHIVRSGNSLQKVLLHI